MMQTQLLSNNTSLAERFHLTLLRSDPLKSSAQQARHLRDSDIILLSPADFTTHLYASVVTLLNFRMGFVDLSASKSRVGRELDSPRHLPCSLLFKLGNPT